MKNFKTTLGFLLVVGVVVAFAIYDYKQQDARTQDAAKAKQLYPNLKVSQIDSFEISGPQSFALQKKNERWFFTQPFSDLADQALFASYLSQVVHSEVVKIPATELKPDRTYGLEKPAAIIRLTTQSGEKLQVKVSSERTFDEGYFLKKDGATDLYVGSNDWTGLINKLPSQLRNKELYLNSPDVIQLTVNAKNQKAFTLVKSKEEWQLKTDSEFPVSKEDLQSYLSQLTTLRADDVLDEKAPSKSPDLKIQLMDIDSKTWGLSFWKGVEGTGDLVMVDGQSTTYLLDQAKGSFLDRQLHELKDKSHPFLFGDKGVTSVSVAPPQKERQIVSDAEMIQKLSAKVKQLRVKTYKPESTRPFVGFLEFLGDKDSSIFKMEWSEKIERGGVEIHLVRTSRSESPFEVAAAGIADVLKVIEVEKNQQEVDAND